VRVNFVPLKKEVFTQLYGLPVTSLKLDFTQGKLYKVVTISDQTVSELASETSKDNLVEIILGIEKQDLLLLSTGVIDGIYGTLDLYSIIIIDEQ